MATRRLDEGKPCDHVFLSGRSYSKMVMHAMKHVQDSVCGVVLGRHLCDASGSANSKGRVIVCIDTIPLLHTHMLQPQLKMGLELVEDLCQHVSGNVDLAVDHEESNDKVDSTKEDNVVNGPDGVKKVKSKTMTKPHVQIVAFYYCDATVTSAGGALCKGSTRIADIIRQHYPDVLLCSLEMQRAEMSKCIAKFYSFSGSIWQSVPEPVLHCSEAAVEMTNLSIADASYLNLMDFDDHLCNPEVSPLNLSILMPLSELIGKDIESMAKEGVDISKDEVSLWDSRSARTR